MTCDSAMTRAAHNEPDWDWITTVNKVREAKIFISGSFINKQSLD